MSREKELVKNTTILAIGKFMPKLLTFVTLPILTAQLTKAEYGSYDLITTLVMLVLPIATLQIQTAAFRFLIDCRKDHERSSAIITTIWGVTLPISVVASAVMPLFFTSLSMPVRIMIAVYFLADTIYLTLGQVIRGIGSNKIYSTAAICLTVINTAGVMLSVQLAKWGLLGVVLSLIIANVAAGLYLFLKSRLYTYIKPASFSPALMKEMLAFSWPMVPNNLSSWVLKLSDRLVITGFLGIEANAVYAVANKIPNILSIAQTILVMAWQENASIAVNDKDAEGYYSKMLDTCYSLIFGFTALLIAGTPLIFWLLIKGDYEDAYYQMPVLVLATFFYVMSAYLGGIYIAHKKTVSVGISTMVAAAINLAIDLCFVKAIGIAAGSISTLAAYCALYYYRLLNVQGFQRIRCNMKKQLLQLGIMVIMLVMCFMKNNILNMINLVVGVVVFYVFNRDTILHKLKGKRKAG